MGRIHQVEICIVCYTKIRTNQRHLFHFSILQKYCDFLRKLYRLKKYFPILL